MLESLHKIRESNPDIWFYPPIFPTKWELSIRQTSTEGVRRKSFTIDKKFPENPVVK